MDGSKYEIVRGSTDISGWCFLCNENASAVVRLDVDGYHYINLCLNCIFILADELAHP